MTLAAWRRIAAGNVSRIAPAKWPLVASICLAALANSGVAAAGSVVSGKLAGGQEPAADPLFILGYWRSGTTWLHELMNADPRHCSTTGIQCFLPDSFALHGVLGPVLDAILPETRPQGDMPFSMSTPQEDEFAILNLGLETPYRFMAFPSRGFGPQVAAEFWPDGEARRRAWLEAWLGFLAAVQARNPQRRLVLKSPAHTARLDMILDAFPNARFVHIGREPHALFASNIKLLTAMLTTQTLEAGIPPAEDLADFVFAMHARVYGAWFSQATRIPKGNLHVLRFEELAREPEQAVRDICRALDFGDCDAFIEPLRDLIATRQGHKVQQYPGLDPAVSARIDEEWADYARYFGYRVG